MACTVRGLDEAGARAVSFAAGGELAARPCSAAGSGRPPAAWEAAGHARQEVRAAGRGQGRGSGCGVGAADGGQGGPRWGRASRPPRRHDGGGRPGPHQIERRPGAPGPSQRLRLWKEFNAVFACLPIVALVVSGENDQGTRKRILCVHGGLSPELESLDRIREIEHSSRLSCEQ